MFTPQEVSEKTFPKSSSFSSGYDLAAVDEFLDTLTEDYTALYKENAALKAKLKILAEKLEEYRATEDTMRSMLLAAQKMAASMTDEAKEKSEKMLAEARSQREQILEEAQNAAAVANRDFQQKTEAARQKLSAAEEEPPPWLLPGFLAQPAMVPAAIRAAIIRDVRRHAFFIKIPPKKSRCPVLPA